MKTLTKCKFVSQDRVTVETPQGDRFTLGLTGVVPFELQELHCQIIAALFDKYYTGDPSVIMGPIARGMYQRYCWSNIFWYGPDRNNERELIGARIKSLRLERRMDITDVAQLAAIDASTLSRIEKGKFSPSFDILCRIAAALDCHVDITSNSNRVNMAGHIIPDDNKQWLVTANPKTFHIDDCLAKYGEFHWQQSHNKVKEGDVVYIYNPESREIKYRMRVIGVNIHYDKWMVREEEFWVDKERLHNNESEAEYVRLRLEATSKSGKLIKDNLINHGFLCAPRGAKELTGELLKFIERRF